MMANFTHAGLIDWESQFVSVGKSFVMTLSGHYEEVN